jgi:hypothetical protein
MSLDLIQMRIPQIINKAKKMILSRKSYHFISPPGVGKSSMVHQIGEAEDYTVLDYKIATATPPDIPGYVIPDHDAHGRMFSNNAIPFWTIKPEYAGKQVIGANLKTAKDVTRELETAFDIPNSLIFFDEFGQGDVDVKKACAPVILERRVGRWKLPDTCVVWLASNRMSDRSGVTRSLDFIINRTCEVHVQAHKEDLIEYMVLKGYPALLRAYVDRREAIVFGKAPDEQGPWCTPRSYLAVCDYLMLCSNDGGTSFQIDTEDKAIIAGFIGLGNATDLLTFLELFNELPTKEEILTDPMKAKMPKKLDAQMVVVQMLAYDVTVGTADAIIAYVRRDGFSQDMAVTFAKTAASRNHDLLMTKAFTKWTAENHSLLSSIAALRKMG